MTARRALRTGLWLLAALEAAAGLWQVFLPRSFFDLRWVSYLPPYNEHLMTDVGTFNLALALVLAGAAIRMDRAQVRIALLAFAVYALVHFVFHVQHLGGFPAGDAVAQTVALGALALAPIALLVVAQTRQTLGHDPAVAGAA
jgi:hypothetical protein